MIWNCFKSLLNFRGTMKHRPLPELPGFVASRARSELTDRTEFPSQRETSLLQVEAKAVAEALRGRLSAVDLPADLVFLLIEGLLLGAGYVAIIGLCHGPFFLADCMVLRVKLLGLAFRDFAFADFLVNPPVLVFQPTVDFLTARMFAAPTTVPRSSRSNRWIDECKSVLRDTALPTAQAWRNGGEAPLEQSGAPASGPNLTFGTMFVRSTVQTLMAEKGQQAKFKYQTGRDNPAA
jgi:hypothetical protein